MYFFILYLHLFQDENATSRPVCSFVKPLRAGRLLDTPREAARFVSLIYLDKEPMLGGGGRAEQWTSMHAFMCRNKGVGDFVLVFSNSRVPSAPIFPSFSKLPI